jgi:hypothetical protein
MPDTCTRQREPLVANEHIHTLLRTDTGEKHKKARDSGLNPAENVEYVMDTPHSWSREGNTTTKHWLTAI